MDRLAQCRHTGKKSGIANASCPGDALCAWRVISAVCELWVGSFRFGVFRVIVVVDFRPRRFLGIQIEVRVEL